MTENMEKEINFKCNNPGAVRYGNFINYYQFHPAENRIKMLPTNIWENKKQHVCLDIGCNAGDLTIAIYNHLIQTTNSEVKILGIDLDPTLITRATEKVTNNQNISFQCINIMNNSQKNQIDSFLSENNLKSFDVVFCFSTTMWIHLNYGDIGLKNFLKCICDKSEMIVIEPQPWKCYKTAVKRLKLASDEFPCFKELEIRTNVESFIEEFIGGNRFTKVHESPSSEWGRRVLFFTKKDQAGS